MGPAILTNFWGWVMSAQDMEVIECFELRHFCITCDRCEKQAHAWGRDMQAAKSDFTKRKWGCRSGFALCPDCVIL